MNYGKNKASKRQKMITSKSTMRAKRIGVYTFKFIILGILIAMVVAAVFVGLFIKKIASDTPNVTPEDVSPTGYASFVYDKEGNQLSQFVASGSNRVYKSLDEIPVDMQHAVVAIEDERFYQHKGVDIQGIIRAAVVGITNHNFSEGASTITQQLIKNNVFSNFTEEKTFMDRLERKIQEQIIAVRLERKMSKDEIMENYLNTINLGQNTLGVQSASKRYFGKDTSELTLSECTVIAGITQNPGYLNPISYPDANAKRRSKILKNMLAQGYIDQAQYDEAVADDVYSRIQGANIEEEEETSETDSYFIDAIASQLMKDLQSQLNYSETQAFNAIYRGGLSVTATIDPAIQAICDEEVNNDSNYPYNIEWGITSYALSITRADGSTENYDHNAIKNYAKDVHRDSQGLTYSSEDGARAMIEEWKSANISLEEGDSITGETMSITPQPQASIVVMDQTTGEVKAIVGGRGTKSVNRSYDRAIDSMRQPGSCFKILSTYAPALDAAGKTLATTIKDEEFFYDNGVKVNNWWGNSYKGNVTVRSAIEQSMNVATVKMLTEITPQLGFNYLLKFGFTTLVDKEEIDGQIYTDIQQSLALGGITHGITNLEMTAAYAAIANKGVYNKPIFYTQIKDHDGNVLLDNTGNSHQVLKESTAFLLTNAMEDVVKGARGTGGLARLSNMPVSGKTGTTNDDKDIWFSAYTPYYTCSVWSGYDDNKELSDTGFHLRLWRSIMSRIHSDLAYKEFEVPSSVTKGSVCSITGLLPTRNCPVITEYFAKDGMPTKSCPGTGGSHYNKEKEEKDKKEKEEREEREKREKEEREREREKENENHSSDSNVTPSVPDTEPSVPEPPEVIPPSPEPPVEPDVDDDL